MSDAPSADEHRRQAATVGAWLRDLPWLLAVVSDTLLSSEFGRLHRVVRPYTPVGNAQLRGLYRALRSVERRGIPGDIVECGARGGGSAALMALALKRWGARRHLWLFDAFDGQPAPTNDDQSDETTAGRDGSPSDTLEEVEHLLSRLGVSSRVTIVRGRFQDTVLPAGVGRTAVLHIAGDEFEDVRYCLAELYDRVTPGGVIQLAELGRDAGAGRAWQEFAAARGLGGGLRWVDAAARQFIKPRPRGAAF